VTGVYNRGMKRQATGVYLVRGNSLLFLVRNKQNDTVHRQGMYLPVGGKVEPGESIADCAIREVKEESGVQINSLELRGIHYIRQLDDRHHDWINFVYTSDNFTGEPVAGNEGHFEWVKRKHFPNIQLYDGDRIYLDYLRDYQFHVAEFLYNGFDFVKVDMLHSVAA